MRCVWEGNDYRHKNEKVVKLAKGELLIHVCPEQLGGLPTPREPAEQRNGRVFTKSGKDVTEEYARGAEETLRIAKMLGVKEVIFRKFSPSWGSGKIFDGTFSGRVIRGDGVTASLLKKNGIRVITEEDL